MKENAATGQTVTARGTTKLTPASSSIIITSPPNPRNISEIVDIAHVGCIWKSPRDKRACIQAGIKSLNGHAYCDLRIFEMDAQGRMRATTKGITVSPQRLMQLAKLVGDAARKAQALGLTAMSS